MTATQPRRAVVILAAGKGTRMKSNKPKVLHEVLGEAMLGHVLRLAEDAALGASRVVVVTGHERHAVEAYLQATAGGRARVAVEQVDPRGTGHAMQFALPHLQDVDEVVVLYGDAPLLRLQTLLDLCAARGQAAMSLLAAEVPDATGYGRVVLDADGQTIARIIEHKDADAATRAVRLVNAGMVCVDAAFLANALSRLSDDNAQRELYLTDLPAIARVDGLRAVVSRAADWQEILGCNSRSEVADASEILRLRILHRWMAEGVSVERVADCWVESTVQLGRDTTLGAGVELRGQTVVGEDVVIERGCVLRDCKVEAGAHLLPYVIASESSIGPGASVGPCAHLRPGSELGPKVKVGNFVETKKAKFGAGAKASHLSYIGDADIGAGSNIGAGTITCNYDGKNKFKTVLGAGVFIGSDTQLVAPVTLGDGAYVGAGTTVTRDVPAGALAVSRAPQQNIEGWVARKAAKQAEKAASGVQGSQGG